MPSPRPGLETGRASAVENLGTSGLPNSTEFNFAAGLAPVESLWSCIMPGQQLFPAFDGFIIAKS